ncbi:hypothetical protein ACHAXR_006621 [Thalassiosira sp. AJA248-18]
MSILQQHTDHETKSDEHRVLSSYQKTAVKRTPEIHHTAEIIMVKKHIAKVPIFLMGLGGIFIFSVVWDEISSPLLYHTLRGNTNYYWSNIYIPPSLDVDSQRTLSLNLGGGNCKWQPPVYEVPEEIDFHKTLVTGFPSGDKRMAYLQMEALAGFHEWDFAFQGYSNHPFIKGNYPHHEGIWGWGSAADQVVMMVPHIRRSIVEYHDILWDLGYQSQFILHFLVPILCVLLPDATTWEDATLLSDNLYGALPDIDDYYEWRDARVMDEAHWYGWFIDYWMEGGLMRDIFTHNITTKEHWDDLLLKPFFTRAEMSIDNYVTPGSVVSPAFDPHCIAGGDISGGCEPVAVISADKLQDYEEGPAETAAIANALISDERTGQYVIDQEAWDCIWNELIQEKKGPRTMADRPDSETYNFSVEMLQAMNGELDRLITKYSSDDWSTKATAIRLVEILEEHRASIQVEIDEINSGVRKLIAKDFLGPNERAQRRDLMQPETDGKSDVATERKPHSRYFIALEQKRFESKRREMKQGAKGHEAHSKAMSDGDFIKALSTALAQIRTLEAAGGTDRETAMELVDRVREVANEARVMLMDDTSVEETVKPVKGTVKRKRKNKKL